MLTNSSTILLQITRYNALLVEMHSSLQDLQKGIQGLVVLSAELEDIFICIYEGRVPTGWLKGFHLMHYYHFVYLF